MLQLAHRTSALTRSLSPDLYTGRGSIDSGALRPVYGSDRSARGPGHVELVHATYESLLSFPRSLQLHGWC